MTMLIIIMILIFCWYAKAYILHLFDSVLFTNLTKRYIHLLYLMLLKFFDVIPTYS